MGNPESFSEWRERRLSEIGDLWEDLEPQHYHNRPFVEGQNTFSPLLTVEIEIVKPTCTSTICKDKHFTGWEQIPTRVDRDDPLASPLQGVTDWPERGSDE